MGFSAENGVRNFDLMNKRYHMIFVFLWLTSLSMFFSRSIQVAANTNLFPKQKQTHRQETDLQSPEGEVGKRQIITA